MKKLILIFCVMLSVVFNPAIANENGFRGNSGVNITGTIGNQGNDKDVGKAGNKGNNGGGAGTDRDGRGDGNGPCDNDRPTQPTWCD